MTGEEWYKAFELEMKRISKEVPKQKFVSNGHLMMWVLEEINMATKKIPVPTPRKEQIVKTKKHNYCTTCNTPLLAAYCGHHEPIALLRLARRIYGYYFKLILFYKNLRYGFHEYEEDEEKYYDKP